jgi:uncharacterized protein (DUF983 family)
MKLSFWQNVWLKLLGSNCPKCHNGRLSRDLTGYLKKAQCPKCGAIIDVEGF